MSYDPEKALDDHNGHVNHHAGKNGDYAVEIAPAGNERLVQDAVFGDMSEGGPNYRAVSLLAELVWSWWASYGWRCQSAVGPKPLSPDQSNNAHPAPRPAHNQNIPLTRLPRSAPSARSSS